MIKRILATLYWLLELFDPPPLASMSTTQKVSRVLIISATLLIGSIVVAMLGAVGLFLAEKGRELGDTPEFLYGLVIIIIGVLVNVVCVLMLVQIKHADHKIIPPATGKAVAESQIKPD